MPEEKEPFAFPEKIDPHFAKITSLTQAQQNQMSPRILNALLDAGKLAKKIQYDRLLEQDAHQREQEKADANYQRIKDAHQREQEKADANYQRIKDAFLILVTVVAASIALGACWNIASNSNSSDDAKKAAIAAISSVLTSTMSGIGGYLAGKKSS